MVASKLVLLRTSEETGVSLREIFGARIFFRDIHIAIMIVANELRIRFASHANSLLRYRDTVYSR